MAGDAFMEKGYRKASRAMGLGALAAAAAAARRIIPVTFTTCLSESNLTVNSIGKFPFVKFFCVFLYHWMQP